MNSAAKQALLLFGGVIASVSVAAWPVLAARPMLPLLDLVTSRHPRRHPSLREQEPPRWLALLARAVLVLALVALGLATLLDGGAGPH